MRRFLTALAALFLVICLVIPAYAADGVTGMQCNATVASDGGAQVTMTVTLHLDTPVDQLYFPVPREASSVTLNGSRVITGRNGDVRQINLRRVVRNVVGDVTFTVQYSLYDVIHTSEDGLLQMQLPLLSGFAYPVQNLNFTVTMPGEPENLPGFVSGYRQAQIEEHITYNVEGNMIIGNTIQVLNDRETLTMTMPVSEEMFPRTIAKALDYGWATTGMLICGILALLYWCITLWNRPGFSKTQPVPPQGVSGGSLGSLLAGQGTDLSMMVFSWAEKGYVLIQVKGQRVILHKRMEMGNECTDMELRYFKKLFSKRDRVDTSDARYAALCLEAAKKPQGMGIYMRRFNGNPVIFRVLAAGIGAFGGGAVAVAMAHGAALQGLLILLFFLLGGLSGWYIQQVGAGILLRNTYLLKVSLIHAAAWLLLSTVSDAAQVGLTMILLLTVAGLLLAWGGRKTPAGRLAQMQTLGFARYLRSVKKADLIRICRNDPDYFFRLAPYALALGREKVFAKRFPGFRMDRCPYLTTGVDGNMTALQWCVLMRRAAEGMDARARRLPMEKLIRRIRRIIKN